MVKGTLLLILGILFIVQGSADRCQEEVPLPKTLVPENGELYLYGSYRAPLNVESEISLDIQETSYLRLYVAEHDLVDFDVKLFDEHSSLVVCKLLTCLLIFPRPFP